LVPQRRNPVIGVDSRLQLMSPSACDIRRFLLTTLKVPVPAALLYLALAKIISLARHRVSPSAASRFAWTEAWTRRTFVDGLIAKLGAKSCSRPVLTVSLSSDTNHTLSTDQPGWRPLNGHETINEDQRHHSKL
jgi:hypothetical protein